MDLVGNRRDQGFQEGHGRSDIGRLTVSRFLYAGCLDLLEIFVQSAAARVLALGDILDVDAVPLPSSEPVAAAADMVGAEVDMAATPAAPILDGLLGTLVVDDNATPVV